MSIPGYLTPKEAMARFGWKRAQLNATAKREGWQRIPAGIGNAYYYSEQDINDFDLIRNRTELLKKAGWKLQPGLVRHEDWDYGPGCPECGLLAVYTPDEAGWLCVNGHRERSNPRAPRLPCA